MEKLSVVEQITASKEYQAYMAALVALRKRNVTTQEHKKTYWMLTGEGEVGTWERHICTLRGIQRIATRERCGGDRWATIWEEIPETDTTEAHIINIDSGDIRYIPDED